MLEKKRIGGLILMSGEGRRLGGDVPKQFLSLGGKAVYLHTLKVFLEAAFFDEILLVCHIDWIDKVRAEARTFPVRVVEGGKTRQESSFRGLKAFTQAPEVVVIHDAVRPFVSSTILRQNALGALQHGAVDTCIPSADTLVYAPDGKTISEIPQRAHFLRGQTPQSFRFDWIFEAHEQAEKKNLLATDDCRLVLELGKKVHLVEGSEKNLKITTPLDLLLGHAVLKS